MEVGVREASVKCTGGGCVIVKFTGTTWISDTPGDRPFSLDIYTGGHFVIHASLPYFYNGQLLNNSLGQMEFKLKSKIFYDYTGDESKSWGTSEWKWKSGDIDETDFPPNFLMKGGRPNVKFRSHAVDIHATAVCNCAGGGKIF
jgi:hypothetical protein